jgi:hypothetical protein
MDGLDMLIYERPNVDTCRGCEFGRYRGEFDLAQRLLETLCLAYLIGIGSCTQKKLDTLRGT